MFYLLYKGLCNNYQEGGGAEKLELSSKNLDSTPPSKTKRVSSNPPSVTVPKHQWNTKPFHFNSFLVWKAQIPM